MEKRKKEQRKKDAEHKEEETIEKVSTKKLNRELLWVFGVMAGLIIIFLISYSVFQSEKKFEYEGLKFTKEMFGEIPLYHYYYIGKVKTPTGVEQNKKVDIFLRNDPRENNVSIEGEIIFPLGKDVFVGVGDEGVTECDYSIIGIASLSSFLSQNGITAKGGSTDLEVSKATELDYIACDKYPAHAVILINGGEETHIKKTADNCYEITVNNCETLPAIEKFIIQSVLDAKDRRIASGEYESEVELK